MGENVSARQETIRSASKANRHKTFVELHREKATRHALPYANRASRPTKGRIRPARSTFRCADGYCRRRKIATPGRAKFRRLKIRRQVRARQFHLVAASSRTASQAK